MTDSATVMSTAPNPRERVSVEDLEWAATWLEAYEGDEQEDAAVNAKARRVAAMLRAEADQRRENAAVRYLAKKLRTTPARARAALRKTIAGQP